MQHHPEVKDKAWIYNGLFSIGSFPIPAVRRVKIAETVTWIPDKAFQDHQELEEVILSSSVHVIGKWAFRRCKKLKSILYQGLDKEEVGIPSNVKVIEEGAFYGCTSLARLVLNEGLEGIGCSAFCECDSLSHVRIAHSVQVIGKWAFFRCKKLKSILYQGLDKEEVGIPSNVKVIEEGAFYGCTSLARLVLNEGLEGIGCSAFCECDSLSHVRIAHSVNSIATDAFFGCRNLVSIEVPEERSFNFELFGCQSLVSVVGAVSITMWQEFGWGGESFQSSKLGCLVDDEADLDHRLKHRFDNSPLNKLCYYQSYHSPEDEMAHLRSLMEDDSLAATTQVDEFGMTPLHILLLSQTPNIDMLLAVMQAGPLDHIIFCKDSFGYTPMDYLCLNRMPNSNEVIRRVLETRFDRRVSFNLNMFSWPLDQVLAVDISSRREVVVRFYLILANNELKEACSLVKLHLWKMKIDEATDEGETADRESCLVRSGASVVIPYALSFLDNLDKETYFGDEEEAIDMDVD